MKEDYFQWKPEASASVYCILECIHIGSSGNVCKHPYSPCGILLTLGTLEAYCNSYVEQ